jgi:hypothetical protein
VRGVSFALHPGNSLKISNNKIYRYGNERGIFMRHLVFITVIIATLISAGCINGIQSNSSSHSTNTTNISGSPLYTSGDIIAYSGSPPGSGNIILGYDPLKDNYQYLGAWKSADGNWTFDSSTHISVMSRNYTEQNFQKLANIQSTSFVPIPTMWDSTGTPVSISAQHLDLDENNVSRILMDCKDTNQISNYHMGYSITDSLCVKAFDYYVNTKGHYPPNPFEAEANTAKEQLKCAHGDDSYSYDQCLQIAGGYSKSWIMQGWCSLRSDSRC